MYYYFLMSVRLGLSPAPQLRAPRGISQGDRGREPASHHPPASVPGADPHGSRFLLSNQGEGLHYGQSFAIQPSIGGKWYTVQGIQLDFVAIAFDLGLGKA